ARREAARLLDGVTLPDLAKQRVIERAVAMLDLAAELDLKKFQETLAAEAKAEGQYLASITGSGRVIGMGAAPVVIDAKEAKAKRKELKEARREDVDVLESLMGDRKAAKIAADREVA